MASEAAVRTSFEIQADWCARLGSPFTALLCTALAATLDRSGAVGARVLDWPGDPSPGGDALALRLCGGLHFLVRAGAAPALAALYPPAALPDAAALGEALAPLLQDEALLPWLERAPQTNEVGRSAVLMAGLLVAAARFRRPLALYELGASAGLNLQLDRYAFDLGGRAAGDPASAVRLAPAWAGRPPPAADVRIATRQGVDLNPFDVRRDRDRLLAYIWPDQQRRLALAAAALGIAAADPPPVARGDAADWIERALAIPGPSGVTRLVMHSVSFQYFPAAVQARIVRHLARAGAAAAGEAPLAWLRFEKLADEEGYSLRLRAWPDGGDRLLARAHPHASSIRWLD
ncbi:MAG: hypothetical protein QOH47_902 [Sphingomonadales bacterium]|nr:hypothetical protein [Sphingomonadales bacterium]